MELRSAGGFFQFEIMINVSVVFFRFIRIHMLWVYGHYKVYSFSAGIDFRRQILTSKVDPRTERVKTTRSYVLEIVW